MMRVGPYSVTSGGTNLVLLFDLTTPQKRFGLEESWADDNKRIIILIDYSFKVYF